MLNYALQVNLQPIAPRQHIRILALSRLGTEHDEEERKGKLFPWVLCVHINDRTFWSKAMHPSCYTPESDFCKQENNPIPLR